MPTAAVLLMVLPADASIVATRASTATAAIQSSRRHATSAMQISRRHAVAAALAAVVPASANAAIPSISEYSAEQYKRPPPAPPPPSAEDSAAEGDALSPVEGLQAAQKALVTAEASLKAGDLEAVRTLLRRPLFAKFLQFTPGVRGNAANLRAPARLVALGVDRGALEELQLSLKRIDDFCIANRVIVFNVEDLEQVQGLMAATGRDGGEGGRLDIDEGLALVADANEALTQALQSVRVAAAPSGT